MPETVFVLGASGFIAQHIVKLLIEKNYNVVGTVRLAEKGDKLKQNLAGLGGSFSYAIVKDIAADGAFDAVFAANPQIDVVLHTALPFFYDTTDPEKDLIVPAINGTKNVMNVLKKQVEQGACRVKRVVITSSDAAIYLAEDEQNARLSFDESLWNNIAYEDAVKDAVSAYYGAKLYAEKAAWEIARSTANFPPVTAVNPVYVFGPQAFDNEVGDKLNTSNEMINALLSADEFSNDKGGFVDVRDVARAHLAAFEDAQTEGKRLFMTNGKFSVQMMVDVINARFAELKGKVPVGNPGSGPADVLTLAQTSNAATRELLPFEFVLLEQCVVDVVAQILRRGQ